MEAMDDEGRRICQKRQRVSTPSSPSGVIDAYFNSDNSNDSWNVTSSMASSPEPLTKRSRAHDQELSTISWRG